MDKGGRVLTFSVHLQVSFFDWNRQWSSCPAADWLSNGPAEVPPFSMRVTVNTQVFVHMLRSCRIKNKFASDSDTYCLKLYLFNLQIQQTLYLSVHTLPECNFIHKTIFFSYLPGFWGAAVLNKTLLLPPTGIIFSSSQCTSKSLSCQSSTSLQTDAIWLIQLVTAGGTLWLVSPRHCARASSACLGLLGDRS